MIIETDPIKIHSLRTASDARQLETRARVLVTTLVLLGLFEHAEALAASPVPEALEQARRTLLALRAEANRMGANVAPIRTALDQLGALWAVVPV